MLSKRRHCFNKYILFPISINQPIYNFKIRIVWDEYKKWKISRWHESVGKFIEISFLKLNKKNHWTVWMILTWSTMFCVGWWVERTRLVSDFTINSTLVNNRRIYQLIRSQDIWENDNWLRWVSPFVIAGEVAVNRTFDLHCWEDVGNYRLRAVYSVNILTYINITCFIFEKKSLKKGTWKLWYC